MNRMRRRALGFALLCAGAMATMAHAQEGKGDVVYVPTPQVVVDEMLKMGRVTAKDYLIDLGSGDGRILITAARRYGAQGFGVDLDTYLLGIANQTARNEAVADKVQFYERNIFETKLDTATVITSYLLPEMNRKLRPTILKLHPGVRVLAHDYHMGEWLPDEQKTIPVPEKVVGNAGVSFIYMWYVPAQIAGTWVSRINTGQGEVPYEFSLEQTFQEIAGTMKAGKDTAKFNSKVLGERFGFVALPKVGERTVRHEFSGRIKGDRIEGTVKIGEGPAQRQVAWIARQSERRAVRKPSDDVE